MTHIMRIDEFKNTSKYQLPDKYSSTSWWKFECNKINGISLGNATSSMLIFERSDRRVMFTIYFADDNKISNPIPRCFYPADKFADAPIVIRLGPWSDELKMELDKNKIERESGKDYLGCYLIQTEKDAKTFIKCVKKTVQYFLNKE